MPTWLHNFGQTEAVVHLCDNRQGERLAGPIVTYTGSYKGWTQCLRVKINNLNKQL